VLRFDRERHTRDALADAVGDHIKTQLGKPPSYAEVKAANDLAKEERGAPNPLIAASAAVALASMEVPAVIAGGALAAASLPILIRALKGIKSGCMITEQLDMIKIATVASRGDVLSGV